MLKKSLILTISSLFLLCSCGEGASVSSSLAPLSDEEYFSALESARNKTTDADGYRAYTPHANTRLGVLENGYLNARVGMKTKVEEEGEEDSIFSLQLKKVPLDIRYENRNSKDSNDLKYSLSTIDDDVDGKMNAVISGYTIKDVNFPNISVYGENGDTIIDAYALSRVLKTFTGTGLPYNGRVIFPGSDEEVDTDYLRDILKELGIERDDNSEFDIYRILNMIDMLSLFGGFDLGSLIKTVNGFDYDLFKAVGATYWTLENNDTIKLSITGEKQLRRFFLDAYDEISGNVPRVGRQGVTIDEEEAIDNFLKAVDFDSLSVTYRWNDSGVFYTSFSFLINDFVESEFTYEDDDGEKVQTNMVPYGELSLSYGLCYEYENVEVLKHGSLKDYTTIDREAIADEVLDRLKELIEEYRNQQGSSSSSSSSSSEEESSETTKGGSKN